MNMLVPSLADKWNRKCNRPPKEACRHDGRLILLSNEDINEIKEACTQEQNVIGRGGFGTVYKQWNGGFGMSIAIKKIVADKDEKKNSARKEMLASRILHPFILPLLSVFEDHAEVHSHFYFISPYCEKGNLYSVLEECRKSQVNSLNQMQRIRIALQLALAIQYLHTPVPNFRGIILHKDISSSNVVLDNYYNARLIDFGLARENDDITTTASGKVPYLHPEVGKKSASVFWDYFALGVVIRELLTGLPPSGKENVHLRCMSHSDIISNLALVWPTDDDDSAIKAIILNTAAQRCLDAKEETFEIKIHVIDEIKTVFNASVMDSSESNKCVLCMINPDGSQAAKQMKHQENCRNTIRLCIACEKNSFLNPVTCYWCSFTLKPIIGYGWGALLVAGNDTNSDENANAFKSDMEKMKKVFTSRAPLVMGIREEHIRTVALREPGRKASEEKLLPLVVAALEEISKMDIHTLVVYFSCHGDINGENIFQLASKKDNLTLRSFQEMLSQLKNVQKIIVMLDRCFADKLTLPPNKVIVQLNACGREESAPIRAKESLFTKYLIKGLQAKTNGNMCEKDEKLCKYCEDYWATRNDYITVERLLNFVSGHMEAEGNPKPRCYVEGSDDDVKLAYYTDEEIFLEFIEEGDTIHDIRQVPVAFCQNLDELKMQLFNNVDGKDVELCIKSDTFRKENRFELCDTIDKVMMAWVLRKRLTVQLLERGSLGRTTVLYQDLESRDTSCKTSSKQHILSELSGPSRIRTSHTQTEISILTGTGTGNDTPTLQENNYAEDSEFVKTNNEESLVPMARVRKYKNVSAYQERKKLNRTFSSVVCFLLDNIGYRYEMRRFRESAYKIIAHKISRVVGYPETCTMVTGSKGEGASMPLQGDYDFMLVAGDISCVENNSRSSAFYILKEERDDRVPPGYTRTVAVHTEAPSFLGLNCSSSVVYFTENGLPYVSSTMFNNNVRETQSSLKHSSYHFINDAEFSYSGPALTRQRSTSVNFGVISCQDLFFADVDIVHGIYFYSSQYTSKLATRLSRRECFPPSLIDSICSTKGYIVPVGSIEGENPDLEWRISYVRTENKIIRNLNSTQFKLYVIMKMIAKELINPDFPVISSYVVKNVVLWICELNSQVYDPNSRVCELTSQPDLLLDQIAKCLSFMRTCIINNHLPNYVIPERNLINSRLTLQSKQRLIGKLGHLLVEERNIFCRLKIFIKHSPLSLVLAPSSVFFYGRKRDEIEKLYLQILSVIPFQNDQFFTTTLLENMSDKSVMDIILKFTNLLVPEWITLTFSGQFRVFSDLSYARLLQYLS